MPIPDGMSFEEATAMVNYQTAYFGLVWRGGIKAGETVLVHGAAGGTGTSAIQVARGLGASVIAIARGDEKLAVAREAGAEHCIEAESDWLAAGAARSPASAASTSCTTRSAATASRTACGRSRRWGAC